MSEFVAVNNDDFEIEVTPAGAWTPGDPNSDSDMTLSLIEDSNVAINDKNILVNNIAWVVIPGACSLSGFTHTSGASVSPILATAIKVKASNIPVLRENDTGACAGVFTQGLTTTACSCSFKISKAGQDKVKAK